MSAGGAWGSRLAGAPRSHGRTYSVSDSLGPLRSGTLFAIRKMSPSMMPIRAAAPPGLTLDTSRHLMGRVVVVIVTAGRKRRWPRKSGFGELLRAAPLSGGDGSGRGGLTNLPDWDGRRWTSRASRSAL